MDRQLEQRNHGLASSEPIQAAPQGFDKFNKVYPSKDNYAANKLQRSCGARGEK